MRFEFDRSYKLRVSTDKAVKPVVTVKDAIDDLPEIKDHLEQSFVTRGRNFRNPREYRDDPESDFAQQMRSWPGYPESLEQETVERSVLRPPASRREMPVHAHAPGVSPAHAKLQIDAPPSPALAAAARLHQRRNHCDPIHTASVRPVIVRATDTAYSGILERRHNDTDLMTEEQLDTVIGRMIATVIVAANRPRTLLMSPRARNRVPTSPRRRNLVSLWPGPALASHRNQNNAVARRTVITTTRTRSHRRPPGAEHARSSSRPSPADTRPPSRQGYSRQTPVRFASQAVHTRNHQRFVLSSQHAAVWPAGRRCSGAETRDLIAEATDRPSGCAITPP